MSMLINIAKCIYIYIYMMHTVILKSMMCMYHHTMQGRNLRGGMTPPPQKKYESSGLAGQSKIVNDRM
jgi:hypothetical protein